MKLVLLCLFNILLSDTLSDWLKLNSNTINSDSYRISFSQKDESMIGGHAYSQIDTSTKIFVLNNQIRYQSRDKIIILAKSEFKLFNKRTSQLFIDVVDENLAMFSSTNLIELLSVFKKLFDTILLFNHPIFLLSNFMGVYAPKSKLFICFKRSIANSRVFFCSYGIFDD